MSVTNRTDPAADRAVNSDVYDYAQPDPAADRVVEALSREEEAQERREFERAMAVYPNVPPDWAMFLRSLGRLWATLDAARSTAPATGPGLQNALREAITAEPTHDERGVASNYYARLAVRLAPMLRDAYDDKYGDRPATGPGLDALRKTVNEKYIVGVPGQPSTEWREGALWAIEQISSDALRAATEARASDDEAGEDPWFVHDHGVDEGRGTACREYHLNGRLVGACKIAAALTPTEPSDD
jgi:hypothetical protein